MTIDDNGNRIALLWGKTSRQTGDFHPALHHMLDVAHVARALLGERASPRWRRRLAAMLGTDAERLADWLPWIIALHDVGKLSVSFQAMDDDQKRRLKSLGFDFGQWRPSLDAHHTTIGQVFVRGGGLDAFGVVNDALRRTTWETIGGHHGEFCDAETVTQARRNIQHYEPEQWVHMRAYVTAVLRDALDVRWPDPVPTPDNVSGAVMTLTGFTILCDWLGSDERVFACQPEADLATYLPDSQRRAEQAVRQAGLWADVRSPARTGFDDLFPDLQPARPLQRAIDAIPAKLLEQPCLVIIEAPTGEGKTEAALALAHRIGQAQESDEFYYALPTMATSNQMFGRVQEHLRDRLRVTSQAKLVHGQAFLMEDDLRIEPLGNGTDAAPQPSLEWFGPKKRALLAPFGVGTIDQAELGALNVRHNALRLMGLAGKVVILDEVHAYDTYMTAVVCRLLTWLSLMGTPVILLSATLPHSRRQELARAYAGRLLPDSTDTSYPSLWVVGREGAHRDSPPAYQPAWTVALNQLGYVQDDADGKARWLADSVAGGGCACWITNTVDRAQRVFEALTGLVGDDVDLMLLHARFPLAQRQTSEERLKAMYGPTGVRPHKGIVIGTQVLEQSLDLDFDVMVSDLAPVDLLLQRAGRLHRHRHHDKGRPTAHKTARLWLNRLVDDEGALQIERADSAVYDEYILRQTWAALADRQEIVLPRDYRPLVESVYSAEPPAPGSPLTAAWEALKKKQMNAEGEAKLRLLPEPDAEGKFCEQSASLSFKEDENSSNWIVAKTRLGEESVGVIPLECRGRKARLPGSERSLNLDKRATREDELTLLRYNMRISQPQAVAALKATRQKLPALFGDSSLLRDYVPLWMVDGMAELRGERGTLQLRLDDCLGLVIRRKEGRA